MGVLYILDEPSHRAAPARQPQADRDARSRLRDQGNTVLVVEHDEDTMRAADHLDRHGPGCRRARRHVVAEGTPADGRERTRESITGAFLSGRRRIELPAVRRTGRGWLLRSTAPREHNLQEHRRRDPRSACFGCVTGVSGSGKSTLVNDDPLRRSRSGSPRRPQRAGRARAHRGARALRQGHRHRPVADRAHAALEPGDLHRASSTTSASFRA